MKAVITLLTILAASTMECVSGSVVKLEVDTFDQLTAGKTVFIKFFAPWVCNLYERKKKSIHHKQKVTYTDALFSITFISTCFFLKCRSVVTVSQWHQIGKS